MMDITTSNSIKVNPTFLLFDEYSTFVIINSLLLLDIIVNIIDNFLLPANALFGGQVGHTTYAKA